MGKDGELIDRAHQIVFSAVDSYNTIGKYKPVGCNYLNLITHNGFCFY